MFPALAEFQYVSLCFVFFNIILLLECKGGSSWLRALCGWCCTNTHLKDKVQLKPGGGMLTNPVVDSQFGQFNFLKSLSLKWPADSMPMRQVSLQETHLQRWNLLDSVWSCSLGGFSPSSAMGWWEEAVCVHCTDAKCSCTCSMFALPIIAHSASLKGQSTVFHFVTSNNYLSNSLWWELALRRLLWLQEGQEDAPDDTLCYFSCAFLLCSVKADSGAFSHHKILGLTHLQWCRCLHLLASHSTTALQFKHFLNP